MKKRLIFGAALLIIATITYALFSYSYIEVSVSDSAESYTYSLKRQGSDQTTEFQSDSSQAKRLVRRGQYEVTVRADDKSYFSLAEADGFLATTTISAKLTQERARSFMGNNPGPCMTTINSILVSAGCGAAYNQLQVHQPATAQQPTYIRTNNSVIEGTVEGFVSYAGRTLVLIKSPEIGEEQGAPHSLYDVNSDLELRNGTALASLNPDLVYTAVGYKDGFLVHDSDITDVQYISSPTADAQKIDIGKPSDDSLKAYYLAVHGNEIIIMYSNNSDEELADVHDINTNDVKTEVVIVTNGKTRRLDTKGQFLSGQLCGKQKLCLFRSSNLEVYDITSDKPNYLYRVNGVQSMGSIGGDLVLARDGDVLGFDIEKRAGYLQYRYGDYQYCGIQYEATRYILCLINNRSDKVALAINPAVVNTDSIDKKIAELLGNSEFKDISIYGNRIFISPDVGDPQYNADTNTFAYDPTAVQNVRTRLAALIKSSGIDTARYEIVNTLD